MNHQHIRNNATTFQLPFILSKKPEHGISTTRSNVERYSIRNVKTQPTINFDKFDQIKNLNLLSSSKASRKNTNKNIILRNNENENHGNLIRPNIENNNFFSPNLKINNNNNPIEYTKKNKTAVKSSYLPRNGRNIISIRVENNWENASTITMYFIALFDKKKRQIKDDIFIASIPEPSSLIKLRNLLDSSYIQEEKKNFFCEFLNKDKFTILISIDQSIEIGSILIFNPPTKSQSAVKDISIFINEKFCFKGRIPQDFGIDLNLNDPLITNESNLPNIEEDDQENQYEIATDAVFYDDYGILPIKPIHQIKIEVLETYNCAIDKLIEKKSSDKNYVGVNGFDFYDILGNLIPNQSGNSKPYHCVKEVNIRGMSDLIHCGMLLKENKVTNNKNEMLLGLMDNIQYPSFNFHFNRPICVSKISIWNFNGFGDDLCYGIKKLKIYADNKLVWLGKIPCGNGKKEEILYLIKLYQPNTNVNEFKV